jgi:hypothetical protein
MYNNGKKNAIYHFVSNNDIPNEYNGEKPTHFYQLASFANPKTGTHNMRKYTINYLNEFLNVEIFNLTKKQYNHFLKDKKLQKYKLYNVYDLKLVSHPTIHDIMTSKSDILQNNYDYTGYAPF